jgi:hypothetical protein
MRLFQLNFNCTFDKLSHPKVANEIKKSSAVAKDSASHSKSFQSTDTRYTRGRARKNIRRLSVLSFSVYGGTEYMQNGRKVFFLFLSHPFSFPYHRFATRCRGKRRQATAKAATTVPLWCGAKPYHFEVYDWGQLFLRYFLSESRLSKILHRHAELFFSTSPAIIDLSLFLSELVAFWGKGI